MFGLQHADSVEIDRALIEVVPIRATGEKTGKTGRSYKTYDYMQKPAAPELQLARLADGGEKHSLNAGKDLEDEIPF